MLPRSSRVHYSQYQMHGLGGSLGLTHGLTRVYMHVEPWYVEMLGSSAMSAFAKSLVERVCGGRGWRPRTRMAIQHWFPLSRMVGSRQTWSIDFKYQLYEACSLRGYDD